MKLTADELLQRRSDEGPPDRQAAELWLRDRLATGPVAVRVLKDENDLAPYSWDTIKRAAKELGIRGEGEKKARVWMLPGQAPGAVVTVDFGGPKKTAAEPAAPAAAPTSLEDVPIVKD